MEYSEGDVEIVEMAPDEAPSEDGERAVRSIFASFKRLNGRGTFALAFGFPEADVRADSQVAVSIAELTDANVMFLGNATMGVLNVIPSADGTIIVRAHIDWETRL